MLMNFFRRPPMRLPSNFGKGRAADAPRVEQNMSELSDLDRKRLEAAYTGAVAGIDLAIKALEDAAMMFQADGRTRALAAVTPTLINLSAFRYSAITRDLRAAGRVK